MTEHNNLYTPGDRLIVITEGPLGLIDADAARVAFLAEIDPGSVVVYLGPAPVDGWHEAQPIDPELSHLVLPFAAGMVEEFDPRDAEPQTAEEGSSDE